MWNDVVDYVERNLSALKEIQAWENMKPKGRSFEEYVDWYRDFVRVGNDLKEGAVTELQWMTAYRKGLMWRNYFEREFIELRQEEEKEGAEWDLSKCHAWMMSELRRKMHVQQYKTLYEEKPQSMGPRFTQYKGHMRAIDCASECGYCKKFRHTQEQCYHLHPHLRPSSTPFTTPDASRHLARGVQPDTEPSRRWVPRSASAPSRQPVSGKANSHGDVKGGRAN